MSDGTTPADTREVVLGVDVAAELEALLADRPGPANEALLDDALDALDEAAPAVPPEAQELAAAGDAVVLGLPAETTGALENLIRRGRAIREGQLRRVRRRLQGKLDRARQKRRS